MSLRRLSVSLLGALMLGLGGGVLSVPALAATTSNPVIQDCLLHPGGLSGHYSVAALNNALQAMPAETKEYTNCPDVINRARLAALHGLSGGGSGGSGSFLPTPVLIVLVLLVLAAVTFGALAVRRRQAAAEDPGGPGDRGPEGPPPG